MWTGVQRERPTATGIRVESRGPERLVLAHSYHSQTGSHSQCHLYALHLQLHPVVARLPQNFYSKLLPLRLTTTLDLGRTAKPATWDRTTEVGLTWTSRQPPPQSHTTLFLLTQWVAAENAILSQPGRVQHPKFSAPFFPIA